MLLTKNLSYQYGGKDKPVLQFPDINCGDGEQWLLLGQSGSGKTTLLQLLAGLRTPKTGEVIIKDTVINQLNTRALDYFRGQHVGVVFQQSHFVRSLTVSENLALARHLAGLAPDKDLIRSLLIQLNVAHKLNARPQELSVGEQQRIAIARALVNQPNFILADEPTSALDDKNTEQVVGLLRQQAEQAGATLLVVTHDNRLKTIFDQQITL
ncbi:MAG: ABC transporter ATP-binding protein [Bacteroidota bacterium]